MSVTDQVRHGFGYIRRRYGSEGTTAKEAPVPDEYVLRIEASGEVTPAPPKEVHAAEAYTRAFNTPPSAEAAAYMRDRLAARTHSEDATEPEPDPEEGDR
ncbi:hypothetical protein ABZ819_05280 [Streptomyces venezuelae]|uniref:hypothetical protein n=1 Tax=Streptomyces venezuelae TaxID=54571 RepID=UPI0034451571